MDADYGGQYRDLYERHWWWRARERQILDVLHRYRPASGWRAILDVGCGDGLFFDRLSELGNVEGVEADASLVNADGPHRERIHIAPFDARFQPGKRYSLLLMLDVLEHLCHPSAALRHAVELLEPGGMIVITVPAFMVLWTTHDELNRHVTRYTTRRLVALARDAGLDVLVTRYFFHWLCLPKLLLRLGERVIHRDPAPPRIPPRAINQALYWLSRAEQRTLSGLRLPLGSSLIAVARKPIALAAARGTTSANTARPSVARRTTPHRVPISSSPDAST